MAAWVPGRDAHATLRDVVRLAVPGLTSADFAPVPSVRPQVRFFATTPDAGTLMLLLSPRAARLLRFEKCMVLSEALLLQWLSCTARNASMTCPHLGGDELVDTAMDRLIDGYQNSLYHAAHPLQAYLPKLMDIGLRAPDGRGSEYILFRPLPGILVAALPYPLSVDMRNRIDFQIGQLLRRISKQQSPDGGFGTAVALLSPKSSALGPGQKMYKTSLLHTRHACWYDAFLSILEATLRDAEDFKVVIRYEAIRDHVNRFGSILSAVKRSCLVAIDAGEDTNTLVSDDLKSSKTGEWIVSNGNQGSPRQAIDAPSADRLRSRSSAFTRVTISIPAANTRQDLRVTGIQEWSNCIFGDPLFASVLSRNSSSEVWKGFSSTLPDEGPTVLGMEAEPIDDMQNARIRRLLYECYHAVTDIVREYCWRRADSDAREMPARKRLTEALKKLDALDNSGREKRLHPVGDSSPAKRVKVGGERLSAFKTSVL